MPTNSFIDGVREYADTDMTQSKDLRSIAKYQLCHEILREENNINNIRVLNVAVQKRVKAWESWKSRNDNHKGFDIKIYHIATQARPTSDTPLDLEVFKYCILIATGQKVVPKTLDEVRQKCDKQLNTKNLEQEKIEKEKLEQDKLRQPFVEKWPALNQDEIDGLRQRLENMNLDSEKVEQVIKEGQRVQVIFSNKTKETMPATTLSGYYKTQISAKPKQ